MRTLLEWKLGHEVNAGLEVLVREHLKEPGNREMEDKLKLFGRHSPFVSLTTCEMVRYVHT